jgi:peptide-methionine (S)-S-oxide reductase
MRSQRQDFLPLPVRACSCMNNNTDAKGERLEKATFGAGCFWGVEETYRKMKGVVGTRVGFLGGEAENPTYEDVCRGSSGHTEVVEVVYDPALVSYEDLLHVFWNVHDPTFAAKTQYQSVIFYHNPQQEAAAKVSKERIEKSGFFQRDVLTRIMPAPVFYEAEEYHQKFFQKRNSAAQGKKT